MKFQPDVLPGTNVVTRHQPQTVWVGAVAYEHSILVPWQGEVRRWAIEPGAPLDAADFEAVCAMLASASKRWTRPPHVGPSTSWSPKVDVLSRRFACRRCDSFTVGYPQRNPSRITREDAASPEAYPDPCASVRNRSRRNFIITCYAL